MLLIFSPNFGEFDKISLVFAQILPDFCRIFAIRPRRNVQGTRRVPGGYPGGSPQFAFSRKTPHTAPPKKLASSSARPQAAALRDEERAAVGGVAGSFVEGRAEVVRVPMLAQQNWQILQNFANF